MRFPVRTRGLLNSEGQEIAGVKTRVVAVRAAKRSNVERMACSKP